MNTKKCLNAEKLIRYIDVKLKQNERRAITIHLAQCEICTKNLRILQGIDKLLLSDKEKNQKMDRDRMNEECITNELFYEYLEGRVSEEKAITIEHHLNSCPICFQEFASLLRNTLSPITDFEKSEISKLRNITAEEQVAKIISYYEPLAEKIEGWKKAIITVIIKFSLKKIFERRTSGKYYWRPVVAFLFLIICITGSYMLRKYYNTNYQISQAEKLLLENHKIYIEDPRLAGGYGSSGINMLMAPDDEKFSYIEQVKSRINRAIRKGSNSPKAQQLLAQIFIIEQQDQKADSMFSLIKKESEQSAALLNDIGVLCFKKGDWKNAAYNFHSAIEADENFLEAHYNLALVQIKLGKLNEAISILKKYIDREHDKGWRDAAHRLMNTINREIQELN